MLTNCEIHGFSQGIQVSADLSDSIKLRQTLPTYREIIYECEGDPYIRILISEQFVEEHDIEDNGTMELPSHYPEWHDDLVIICERCADETCRV